MSTQDIRVPDLGSFADVPVIEILVRPGDVVEVDAPLITLETDKASMDVPSTLAGTVTEVLVTKGSRVSRDTLIARIEVGAAAASAPPASARCRSPSTCRPSSSATPTWWAPSPPSSRKRNCPPRCWNWS